MSRPSKFQFVILTIATLIILQYVNAGNALKFTANQGSLDTPSILAVGVSTLPVEIPYGASQYMNGMMVNDSQADFIFINVLNENGQSIQLKFPKEVEGKISLKKDDKVALTAGAEGEVVLYVNGTAKNLFILKKDSRSL